MYPCPWPGKESPALYTFYTITTLIIVVLAICLVWHPFILVFREVNTILARVIIYIYKEIYGYQNACFFTELEAILTCPIVLCTITFFFIVFGLYLASGDFLRFAGCFVCNWPNHKALADLKKVTLDVIQNLLNLLGNGKNDQSPGKPPINIQRPKKNDADKEKPAEPKNIAYNKTEPRKRAPKRGKI